MVHLVKRLSGTLSFFGLVLTTICLVLISLWLALPGTSRAGLFLLAVVVLAIAGWPGMRSGTRLRAALAWAWIASLIVPAGFWLEAQRSHLPDLSHALLAGLAAFAIFLTSRYPAEPRQKKPWQALAASWAFAGAAVWLVSAYWQNDRLEFHLAALVAVGLLVLCKLAFRLSHLGMLAANTLILVLVFLPAADFFTRPRYKLNPEVDDGRRLYSYEAARQDPSAFAAWWQLYVARFHVMLVELANSGTHPHLSALAPNGQASFFRSRIRVNNKGFRGPDLPDEKGDAYRIVALGESTTFGMTINPEDQPWPEVLERIIRERLAPSRPVRVINAGVPGMTLPGNIRRLPTEILTLQPDLIISYHGINGFGLLDPAMPQIFGHRQPRYRERPLKLLADAEYGIKMALYRRRLLPQTSPFRSGTRGLMETDYARSYRELIRIAETNRIRLVLASFSMAVNDRSPADVVTFYRTGFPSVHWQMQANTLHSALLEELAKAYPDVRLVDTRPNLDGNHSRFIDLIHFNQAGRDQLAENIFAGIKDLLESDLTAKPASHRPGPANE